jgi:NADH dehydrogenase
LSRATLARDFRRIDPTATRIILVEAGPRVLPGFAPRLSDVAARALRRLGVELRFGTPVTDCRADGVTVGEERIESRTVIWAAGVQASPAAEWLDLKTDSGGRIPVGADLTVPGHPDIFVIGDTATIDGPNGKPLPGIATVAKQQGKYVARAITARLAGKVAPDFRYHDLGSLATIGRREAVADFGRVRLSGRLGWLLWSAAHIYFLIGFRNRVVVAAEWLWSYLTYQRGARLIMGVTAPSSDGRRAAADQGPGVRAAPRGESVRAAPGGRRSRR